MSLENVGPSRPEHITIFVEPTQEQLTDYASMLALVMTKLAVEEDMEHRQYLEKIAKWYERGLE